MGRMYLLALILLTGAGSAWAASTSTPPAPKATGTTVYYNDPTPPQTSFDIAPRSTPAATAPAPAPAPVSTAPATDPTRTPSSLDQQNIYRSGGGPLFQGLPGKETVIDGKAIPKVIEFSGDHARSKHPKAKAVQPKRSARKQAEKKADEEDDGL